MSDDKNHELLSAYLDGELSPEEQRAVEQLLVESAECRRVLEELRALKASLAALPRHKLGENLAARVIELGQQAKRGGEEKKVELAAAPSRERSWRSLAYPLVAAAAAAVLVTNLLSPKNNDDRARQVARVPETIPSGSVGAPAGDAARSEPHLDLPKSAAKSRPTSNTDDLFEANSAPAGDELKAKERGRGERLSMKKSSGTARDNKLAVAEAPTVLVIRCQLAPAAVQDKAFDAMLARNSVVMVAGEDDLDRAGENHPYGRNGYAQSKIVAPRIIVREEQEARLGLEKSETADVEADKRSDSRWKQLAKDAPSGWKEEMTVELEPAQLVAVLADLQSHPSEFVSVELPSQTESDFEGDSGDDSSLPAAAPPPANAAAKPSNEDRASKAKIAGSAAGSSEMAGEAAASDATTEDAMADGYKGPEGAVAEKKPANKKADDDKVVDKKSDNSNGGPSYYSGQAAETEPSGGLGGAMGGKGPQQNSANAARPRGAEQRFRAFGVPSQRADGPSTTGNASNNSATDSTGRGESGQRLRVVFVLSEAEGK